MSKLDAIIQEFDGLDFRERLELLLDFSDKLPELPEGYRLERDAGLHRVPECQTPVFLWVEVHDGRVQIQADVAPEAPTVKGFVALLVDGLSGLTPEEVAATPPDLVNRLGLRELGMTRLRGLNVIVQRIRNGARRSSTLSPES